MCGSCSSHKALLPHMSSKPVRVCDECYRALSTKSNDGRHASTGTELNAHGQSFDAVTTKIILSGERLNSDSSSEDSDDDEESERNGVDQTEVGVLGHVSRSNECDDG